MFYKDRGAGVRFAKLFNKIAELFPERKLDQLQDLILGKQKKKQTKQHQKKPPEIQTFIKIKLSFGTGFFFNFNCLDCVDFFNIVY